jgi:hypothetical protein
MTPDVIGFWLHACKLSLRSRSRNGGLRLCAPTDAVKRAIRHAAKSGPRKRRIMILPRIGFIALSAQNTYRLTGRKKGTLKIPI